MYKSAVNMIHSHPPNSIVILTGAGISAESGIKTFRDANGLWETHRFEDVASPEAFRRDPALVQRFYNMRRAQLLSAEVAPNPAHTALAAFESAFPSEFLLVTQNIDDLHERAGSRSVVHMHGELLKMRCQACNGVFDIRGDIGATLPCPACGRVAQLRPHIVWFGEVPMWMERIYEALRRCDLFVAIGTSGNVYPAAAFVQEAARHGAHTVEINLEPSAVQSCFDQHIYGKAGTAVPVFLKELK